MASKHTAQRIIAKGGVFIGAIVASAMLTGATARAPHQASPMLIDPAAASASAAAFAAHPEGPVIPTQKALALDGSGNLAPTLEVVAPKVDIPAHPPFDVRVIAHPRDGLGIDRNSIRIQYGFFRVDVTQRMLSLGHWHGDEFVVSHAYAPTGTHWFYVTIADTAHHAGNVAVKVVVTPS